jgi:AraC-like DNA-binding protein
MRLTLMTDHIDAPRPISDHGRAILSRLGRGESALGSEAPSVKLVLDGEATFIVDGLPMHVQPGQFLYVDQGRPCTGITRNHSTALCLLLPVTRLKAPSSCPPLMGRSLVLSTRTSDVGRTLENWGGWIARNPAKSDQLVDSLIKLLAGSLERPLGESRTAMEALGVVKASTRRELYQRLECARGHLHDHPDRAVSLAELGRTVGLSQFHLARFFKMAFGAAPIAYHRVLRLERAAALLMSGNHTLSEVAELTGYSDEVALSHAFRRHYGKPPQSWAAERRRT